MLLKGCVIKDYVYKNAFSKYGRYTPIGMLFTCGLALIPLIWKAHHPDEIGEQVDWARSKRNIYIAAALLSIFALGIFIFTYAAMGPTESALAFVFKKGYLGWSIAYLIWYFVDCLFECNVFHVMYRNAQFDVRDQLQSPFMNDNERPSYHLKRRMKATYACMVLYSVLIGAMAFGFRDIVMCLCGMFFMMGHMVLSAKAEKDHPDWWEAEMGTYRRKGNLATSAVMFCLLILVIIMIIVFYKKKALM